MPRAKIEEEMVILTLVFSREGDEWVGVCRELGTSTFDTDLNKAKDELCEMVLDHLNGLEEVGERKRFFREHRIRVYKRRQTTRPPAERKIRLPVGSFGGPVLFPISQHAIA
jgi:hypothetical protein